LLITAGSGILNISESERTVGSGFLKKKRKSESRLFPKQPQRTCENHGCCMFE
jgi:hypothetical protein